MQAAGFYHAADTRATDAYRGYNTWMGDPIRALQAREMISFIKAHGLVQHTAAIGDELYSALQGLGKKYSGQINRLRGKDCGTFIAWDAGSAEARDRFVAAMRQQGVVMGGCGEKAVRLRPMLVFGDKQLAIFLDKMETVLKQESGR